MRSKKHQALVLEGCSGSMSLFANVAIERSYESSVSREATLER